MKSLAPFLLVSAACTARVEHDRGAPPPKVYAEIEPNDTAYLAPSYGGLAPGQAFTIVGNITSSGPDFYDGFSVRADAPCTIDFELVSHSAFTDLDLCVYDPELGEFVVCAEGPYDPEKGQVTILEVGKVVQFVVTSSAGATGYSLGLCASAYGYSFAALQADESQDPVKAARRAGYLTRAEPEDGARRPVPLPAEVLEFDLATGAVLRRPALIERRAVR